MGYENGQHVKIHFLRLSYAEIGGMTGLLGHPHKKSKSGDMGNDCFESSKSGSGGKQLLRLVLSLDPFQCELWAPNILW